MSLAKLQGANLCHAKAPRVIFFRTEARAADLREADLRGARIFHSDLSEAKLFGTDLSGARLQGVSLSGAELSSVMFDGRSILYDCDINEDTVFSGSSIRTARLDPGVLQFIEYTTRRKRWREWSQDHRFLGPLARFFLHVSDYGRSTPRVLGWFVWLALAFALVYYAAGCWSEDGLVTHLFLTKENVPIPLPVAFCRAIYFSVVTMTTLGFGDIAAAPTGYWGHILLTLQVLLGYFLLGCLITRLAVLFTTDGPPYTLNRTSPTHLARARAWSTPRLAPLLSLARRIFPRAPKTT